MFHRFGGFVKRTWKKALVCAGLGGSTVLMASQARADGATLPNIGVDVSGYVTSMGTTLGGVLAVVIGVGIAIFIAKKGYRLVKGV